MTILPISPLSLNDKSTPIDPRTQHAAVRTSDGIHVSGGFRDPSAQSFVDSSAALHVRKDLSLLSLGVQQQTSPVAGHTMHFMSSSLISLFGLQPDGTAAPALSTHGSVVISTDTTSPPPRFHHTSTVIENTMYIVAGTTPGEKALILSDIWTLSWPSAAWTFLTHLDYGLSGHATIPYRHWLLSCFGATDLHESQNDCIWFDTHRLKAVTVHSRSGWPSPRIGSSMINLSPSNNSTRAVLFGGRTGDGKVLGDLWLLDLSEPRLIWTQLASTSPRTGHTVIRVNDTLLMYYGGQSSESTMATTPLFLDTDQLTWTQSTMHSVQKNLAAFVHISDSSQDGKENGLSGGVAAGIAVTVVAFILLVAVVLVWIRSKRQKRPDQSRAERFSLSQSPVRQSTSTWSRHLSFTSSRSSRMMMHQCTPVEELPARPDPSRTRSPLHSMLFGPDFHLPPLTDVLSSFHSDKTTSTVQVTAPYEIESPSLKDKMEAETTSSQQAAEHGPFKQNNHTRSLKRFTLGLFSTRQNEVAIQSTVTPPNQEAPTTPKRVSIPGLSALLGDISDMRPKISDEITQEPSPRRASLFGLRGSRLLQLPRSLVTTSTTPRQSQVSLGEKSVASVQWVEFNHDMDYKGHWPSTTYNLSVTNPRRSATTVGSSCRTSVAESSAQTTPRSATFSNNQRFRPTSTETFPRDMDSRNRILARRMGNVRNSSASTLTAPPPNLP